MCLHKEDDFLRSKQRTICKIHNQQSAPMSIVILLKIEKNVP